MSDFRHMYPKGTRVYYTDGFKIEGGVVSSSNDHYIFVKFDNDFMCMTTGDEPFTAQACTVEKLTRQ